MNDARINEILLGIKHLDDTASKIAAQRAAMQEELLNLIPEESGTYKFENGSVSLAQNNRYDGDAFLGCLTDGQKQRVTSRVLDRAKAKANYPELWEAAKVPNGFRVTIKTL